MQGQHSAFGLEHCFGFNYSSCTQAFLGIYCNTHFTALVSTAKCLGKEVCILVPVWGLQRMASADCLQSQCSMTPTGWRANTSLRTHINAHYACHTTNFTLLLYCTSHCGLLRPLWWQTFTAIYKANSCIQSPFDLPAGLKATIKLESIPSEWSVPHAGNQPYGH